ncbi:MAG: hypothetical protein ABI462_12020, partial [Ignavibacteria bacterium]
MQKLKITVLLEGLSPAELKRLGDFVRSPFYNKNKTLVSLYEFLEKLLTGNGQDNITKENIWQYLNPDKKYDDSRLRSVLSDFKKLCETFLTVVKQESDPLRQRNVLLDTLAEKNLPKNFELISKEISKIFDEEFNRNNEYYLNRIHFERSHIDIGGKNIEKNLDENFIRLSDSIDNFFISAKLDLFNSL